MSSEGPAGAGGPLNKGGPRGPAGGPRGPAGAGGPRGPAGGPRGPAGAGGPRGPLSTGGPAGAGGPLSTGGPTGPPRPIGVPRPPMVSSYLISCEDRNKHIYTKYKNKLENINKNEINLFDLIARLYNKFFEKNIKEEYKSKFNKEIKDCVLFNSMKILIELGGFDRYYEISKIKTELIDEIKDEIIYRSDKDSKEKINFDKINNIYKSSEDIFILKKNKILLIDGLNIISKKVILILLLYFVIINRLKPIYKDNIIECIENINANKQPKYENLIILLTQIFPLFLDTFNVLREYNIIIVYNGNVDDINLIDLQALKNTHKTPQSQTSQLSQSTPQSQTSQLSQTSPLSQSTPLSQTTQQSPRFPQIQESEYGLMSYNIVAVSVLCVGKNSKTSERNQHCHKIFNNGAHNNEVDDLTINLLYKIYSNLYKNDSELYEVKIWSRDKYNYIDRGVDDNDIYLKIRILQNPRMRNNEIYFNDKYDKFVSLQIAENKYIFDDAIIEALNRKIESRK